MVATENKYKELEKKSEWKFVGKIEFGCEWATGSLQERRHKSEKETEM